MKENPIIFTADSICAILDGRKTQTRRVVKPPKGAVGSFVQWLKTRSALQWVVERTDGERRMVWCECPYGQLGDRLWVRETWQHESMQPCEDAPNCGLLSHIYYRAAMTGEGGPDKWRSPIFMPRWASRITLAVTGVQVERVQDISPVDILAEGVGMPQWDTDDVLVAKWIELWDSINAKRGYGWDENPWVWVVKFRRLD